MPNKTRPSGDSPILSSKSRHRKSLHQQISEMPLNPPCGKCGSEVGKLGAGRKPKESSLYCCQCRKLIKWLSRSELRSLLKAQSVNNILTDPIPSSNQTTSTQVLVNNLLKPDFKQPTQPKKKRSPSSGESAFVVSNSGDE